MKHPYQIQQDELQMHDDYLTMRERAVIHGWAAHPCEDRDEEPYESDHAQQRAIYHANVL